MELALFERLHETDETADTASAADPEYSVGFREAAREVIDQVITILETGERPVAAIPTALAKQARRAARDEIPLDEVLRRCYAGDRLLVEWIIGTAGDLPTAALREIVRTQGHFFDCLTTAIAAEYAHELEAITQSSVQRQRNRVNALLRGDSYEAPSPSYSLDAWHTGLIVCGTGVELGIGAVARKWNTQSLVVPSTSDDCLWIWLGGPVAPKADELEQRLRRELPDGYSVALGEPHPGLDGWRLTHIEAQAAFQVARYQPDTIVRCRDVILVSAIMRDPRLVASLIKVYLAPLDGRSNTGEVLRETLKVYFRAEQNAATTANLLEIDRHTVTRRLRNVESRLGTTVNACAPQLRVALAIEELITSHGGSVPD